MCYMDNLIGGLHSLRAFEKLRGSSGEWMARMSAIEARTRQARAGTRRMESIVLNQPLKVTDGSRSERTEEQCAGGSWREHDAVARAWERGHEAEWVRVDRELRGIATRRAALDAEEAHLLRYAEEL